MDCATVDRMLQGPAYFLDAAPLQPPSPKSLGVLCCPHRRPQLFCLDRLVSNFELAHKRLITDTSLSLTAVFFPSPRALVKGRNKGKGGLLKRETGLSVNSNRYLPSRPEGDSHMLLCHTKQLVLINYSFCPKKMVWKQSPNYFL